MMPLHLLNTLLCSFIQRFRSAWLLSGNHAYALTNFSATVAFLETVDAVALGLSTCIEAAG